MAGVIGTNLVTQIGFIVKDVEETKRKYAEFLGLDVPPTIEAGDPAITKTQYKGQPAPEASCLMAFFDVGPGLQIELIQPNGVASVWQDFLDEHGEGVHHIAFNGKGQDRMVAACQDFGMELVQQGEFGNGKGRYSYLAAYKDLKVLVELLENYD